MLAANIFLRKNHESIADNCAWMLVNTVPLLLNYFAA